MKLDAVTVAFNSCGYVVDDKKQLYKLEGGECTFVDQLKRHLSFIEEYKGKIYMVDKYGDCFILEKKPIFLAGIIGMPVFFSVSRDRIFVHDSSSRLWVYHLDGSLETIVFGRGKCLDVIVYHSYVGVIYDTGDESSIYLHLVNSNFHELYADYVDGKPDFNDNGVEYKKNGCTYKIVVEQDTLHDK
ncbi:hypothetical protein PAEPH01_0153 [Pancytospora epiphaga]|nr:hypothetical protein PAEPH01_0153 [Pancytospora epiphaga]